MSSLVTDIFSDYGLGEVIPSWDRDAVKRVNPEIEQPAPLACDAAWDWQRRNVLREYLSQHGRRWMGSYWSYTKYALDWGNDLKLAKRGGDVVLAFKETY